MKDLTTMTTRELIRFGRNLDCFGIAIPVERRCSKNKADMAMVLEAVDSQYDAENNVVMSEKTLWFKKKNVVKKVVKTSAIAEERDTCWLDDAGLPGSAERIAALRAHYEQNGENSAFVATDAECADELIQKFANNELIGSGKITPMDECLHNMIKTLAQEVFE